MFKGSTQLNSAPDDYFWLFKLHDPEAGLGVDMLSALDRNPIVDQTCDPQ
jgi:hypothetical protein